VFPPLHQSVFRVGDHGKRAVSYGVRRGGDRCLCGRKNYWSIVESFVVTATYSTLTHIVDEASMVKSRGWNRPGWPTRP
jgi:hypothetical protein